MNESQSIKFLARVSCATYNHAPYIVDTLNGFTMQETSFPFVCTIIDDASTDGEQVVIREYLEEHFDLYDKSIVRNEETDDYVLCFARHKTNQNCFFAVLFLKYNHYSNKKSKKPYIQEWLNTKYLAICEGDDYWIEPYKLSKQVDYIEKHDECSMVCSGVKLFSQREGAFMKDYRCYPESQNLKVNDVILKGGGFVPTCSILFRKCTFDDYPQYCNNSTVGDWPLQIMAAMRGNIFFFQDLMAVYRVDNPNSWGGRNRRANFSKRLALLVSLVGMLQGFAADYPEHKPVFQQRIFKDVIGGVPTRLLAPKEYQLYVNSFKSIISDMDKKQKKEFRKNSSLFYRIYRRLK